MESLAICVNLVELNKIVQRGEGDGRAIMRGSARDDLGLIQEVKRANTNGSAGVGKQVLYGILSDRNRVRTKQSCGHCRRVFGDAN